MKPLIYNLSEIGYQLRTELRRGREHWILPVVMMVEGVHNGSRGPLLYSLEEMQRAPSEWNGVPITIGHPTRESGDYVSINDLPTGPNIVGQIENAIISDDKLKADACIDIQVLQETSADAYEYIKEGKALEVSTGMQATEVPESGDWNNEEYRAIATNFSPDHLALLPNSVGACSWDDGCGIRNQKLNKKGEIANEMKELKDMNTGEFKEYMISNSLVPLPVVEPTLLEEVGFREVMQNIQQKLDQLDNSLRAHYLEEVFNESFVYRVHNRENGETEFFLRSYTVGEDGSVDFEGDPTQVRKETSFVSLSDKLKRTKFEKVDNKMTRTKNASPCAITSLIENEATQWTEDDRKWLETLEGDQLAKFAPKEVEKAVEITENKATTDKPSKEEDKSEKKDEGLALNGKTIEETVKGILNAETDPEKAIELMPKALQNQLKAGLKMHQDKRASLINGIVKNSKFVEANLTGWADEDLENLHESVVPENVDYSANGGGTVVNSGDAGTDGVSMLNIPKKKEEK